MKSQNKLDFLGNEKNKKKETGKFEEKPAEEAKKAEENISKMRNISIFSKIKKSLSLPHLKRCGLCRTSECSEIKTPRLHPLTKVSGLISGIKKSKKIILIGAIFSLVAFALLIIVYKKLIVSFVGFFVAFVLFFLYLYAKARLKDAERIKRIENSFPDFLQLMASNLRAGMTIDRAMLLSARPEFAPLDSEILNVGKDITTGKSTESALLGMSKRIKSEKIDKTIFLIISGIRAGGNLAILLEQTATGMREKDFVEKRAASNVVMYTIFIFIAASFGAPLLFSLSSLLVETLVNTLSQFPVVETQSSFPMLFSLSNISISINFIKYFSLFFIIFIDFFAALVLGLVSKGEEREGMKYLLPMLLISLALFFVVRFILRGFVAGLFS